MLENKDYELLLGDFREVGKQIPDNSIDLIFTDFPYTNKYIHLLEPFAEFSKRVLKEQGMMLTYMGVYFLDQALETICKYLTYHWQLVIRYAGPRPMLYAYRKHRATHSLNNMNLNNPNLTPFSDLKQTP